jgi:Bor protein
MRIKICMLVVVVLFLGSCQVGVYDLRGSPEVPLAAANSPVTRTVSGGGWSHYLFWGLIPLGRYSPNNDLNSKLRPGEKVGEVAVTETNSFGAGFLAAITYGLYRPRSVSMVANIHGGKR